MKTTTVESLLGVLSLGPKSGYEMRQFMENSTGNFWSESFGQIYPALKKMVAEGLVELEQRRGGGDGHPAKKVYRITAAGEERLRRWLAAPARRQVNRNELLLKVFFGDRAELGVMERQVREFQREFEMDLQRYEHIVPMLEREHAGHPGLPFWRMTLRYGMAEARAMMEWCAETLAELETMGALSKGRIEGGE